MNDNKQIMKAFKALWCRFDAECSEKHQLFFKEHSVRNQAPEHSKGQTLFVLNIPPYATTDSLKHAFTDLCGNVRSVTFSSNKGFKSAYIVFERNSSLDRALTLSEHCVVTLSTSENICLTGLRKWCKDYNNSICNEKLMRKEIEKYIASYDREKERAKRKAEKEKEEDGWITVTSGKKRGKFAPSRKESTIDKIQQKEEERRKSKELHNFYTFQVREAKKQNLAELRKKFELDKKKLQELKVKRTFRPF